MARLRLFASIREAAGNRSFLDLDANSVGELLELASNELGKDFAEQIQICRIWLNGEPVALEAPIAADDEVALLPPVSGGSFSEENPSLPPIKLGIVSMHTSPFAQPGQGDSGGLNVYVQQLAFALAHRGHQCAIYTRKTSHDQPHCQLLEPGVEIYHLKAGDFDLPLRDLHKVTDEFAAAMATELAEKRSDILHANYWLSGVAAHYLKHEFNIPLITTFHTLGKVKQNVGEWIAKERIASEAHIMQCSEIISATSDAEVNDLINLYSADPERIHKIEPGANHAFFSPGNQAEARRALGIPEETEVLLFVGRIQPLKRFNIAVQTLAALDATRPGEIRLVAVGGPSGPDGQLALEQGLQLAEQLGVRSKIYLVDPQPHYLLGTYYRAADLVIVPSITESFGLVALEAAACGVPVLAARVGGLKNLVDHNQTGILVDGDEPAEFVKGAQQILSGRAKSIEMAFDAAQKAQEYSWTATAVKYEELFFMNVSLLDC